MIAKYYPGGNELLWYRSLKAGTLVLLFILFILLSHYVRLTPEPVMYTNDAYISIEAMAKSIGAINSIEYKQHIKTSGLGNKKDLVLMHYYYKRPYHLRVETSNGNNMSVDIYTPGGMYEYFPLSHTAYYREKWQDGKPVSFQLEDKLGDITVGGKYEVYKMDKIGSMDSEIIRNVDEDGGKIYEHRVWLVEIGSFKLPVKEEYLVDGEVNSTHEYEYISINKNIPTELFELKKSGDITIHDVEGIPKIVENEAEAEKYVKFNVLIPEYVPKNFTINEIFIIPPVKTPTVLVSYIADMDTIYLSQKNTGKNEVDFEEADKAIGAGGKKFALRKLFNDSFAVRWVNNGIEYEISGAYAMKDEIVKLIHSISGIWISVELIFQDKPSSLQDQQEVLFLCRL